MIRALVLALTLTFPAPVEVPGSPKGKGYWFKPPLLIHDGAALAECHIHYFMTQTYRFCILLGPKCYTTFDKPMWDHFVVEQIHCPGELPPEPEEEKI